MVSLWPVSTPFSCKPTSTACTSKATFYMELSHLAPLETQPIYLRTTRDSPWASCPTGLFTWADSSLTDNVPPLSFLRKSHRRLLSTFALYSLGFLITADVSQVVEVTQWAPFRLMRMTNYVLNDSYLLICWPYYVWKIIKPRAGMVAQQAKA